jgi:uncharacterized membrane protein YphA (DoxX/SURF4 family)
MSKSRFKILPSNNWLTLIIRVLLAAIFIFAALDKLLNLKDFALGISAYQTLPSSMINPVAIFLPALELAIGLALLAGFFHRGALTIMLILMLVFMGALIYVLAFDIDLKDCSCSLPFFNTEGLHSLLIRDFILVLLILQNLLLGRHEYAMQNLIRVKY